MFPRNNMECYLTNVVTNVYKENQLLRQRIKEGNNRQFNPILQVDNISNKFKINSKSQKVKVVDNCFGVLNNNRVESDQFRPGKKILNFHIKESHEDTQQFKPSKKPIAIKFNLNSLPGILRQDTQPVLIQRKDKDFLAFGASKQESSAFKFESPEVVITKHKRQYSRDVSPLVIAPWGQDDVPSKDWNMKSFNRSLTPNVRKTFTKRIKSYPYKVDHLYEVFHNISDAKNTNITPKINKNSFDILDKVPKFDWE